MSADRRTPAAVVVGTGFIGPVHVEALRRAGVPVAGIVGSSPEKSRNAAARLGLPRGYESLTEALADPDVGVIHLATPNRLHYSQATAALRAGKHVMCEKPLAMTSVESAELVRIAEASGCAAGVAYNIRFYPLCHEAATRMANGSVGELLHVSGSYVQDWLLYDTDFNWRVSAGDGGDLRAVADIGTHWLDLMQFVTGHKITAVCADLRTVHPTRLCPSGGAETFSESAKSVDSAERMAVTTDDCGAVMLRFDNGANGCLWVSQTTAGRKNCLRFEVAGTRKSLAWNSETPNELWIGRRDGANEILMRDPSLLSPEARAITNYPGGHNEGFPDTFKQLFSSFYSYIAAGDMKLATPFPSFADGHREVLLCEAVLRSSRDGCWASL